MLSPNETLAEVIAEREQIVGHPIRVPIPPACQRVWETAQQDPTLHLGQLYALSEPLLPHTGGNWHRTTGDIAIVLAADPSQTVARLLHELGHARRQSPVPATIDQDWEEEVATWQTALDLAQTWKCEALIDPLWIERQIAYTWQLLNGHELAGELAGTRDPALARRAYTAIHDLAAQHGWSAQQREDALYGLFPDADESPDAAWFDRSRLREGWRLTHGIPSAFGPLTCPATLFSKRLLREALRTVAHAPEPALHWTQPPHLHGLRYQMLPSLEAATLATTLGILNTLLLSQPDTFPAGIWHVFGDAPARLYFLDLHFTSALFERSLVWVSATPRHHRDVAAEAAFQQYLASWQTIPVQHVGTLAQGMQTLIATVAIPA